MQNGYVTLQSGEIERGRGEQGALLGGGGVDPPFGSERRDGGQIWGRGATARGVLLLGVVAADALLLLGLGCVARTGLRQG